MKLKILFFLLITTSLVFAQNKYLFDFDYAQFGYDSTSNYVEFYYSFNQNAMTPVLTDSGKYVEGKLHIIIQDTASVRNVLNQEWNVVHKVDTSDTLNTSLVGVIKVLVEKGNYKCSVGGIDTNSKDNGKKISEYISVNPFYASGTVLSDIQIASKILQNSQNQSSIFYKNSYEVVPIPTSVFGAGHPVLFYYAELYNIKMNNDSTKLKLVTQFYNNSGKLLSKKFKLLPRVSKSVVDVGTMVVTKYPSGAYTLILTLVDSSSNYAVSSTKRLFLYNPSVASQDTLVANKSDAASTEFGVMSEEELDDLFSKSKYIATSAELEQYPKVNSEAGKREFLYNFWKQRDTDPSTKRNEFYPVYLNRINESNSKFGTLTKPGWKTDRGRILVSYGEPDEIERFPNQIDTKPYEIWHYNNIEGGVIFIFADLSGFSDYTLINSTMRSELRDDDWMRRISTM